MSGLKQKMISLNIKAQSIHQKNYVNGQKIELLAIGEGASGVDI